MIRIAFDGDAGGDVAAVPGLADRLRKAVETHHLEILTVERADVVVTREPAASAASPERVVWDLDRLRRYLDSVEL